MSKIENPNQVISDIIKDFSYNITLLRLETKLSTLPESEWIKNTSDYNTHSDFCFTYNNYIFSVIIDIQDKNGNSLLSEKFKEQQLASLKKYNFIPCKFPLVLKKSGKTSPLTNGWNLFDINTNTPVNPEDYDITDNVSLDWVKKYYGITYVKDFIENDGNQIVSIQDINDSEPQIWFMDKYENKTYVIIKTNEDSINIDNIVKKYKNNNGYIANITIKTGNNTKILSKNNFNIILDDYSKINNVFTDTFSKYDTLKNENVYNLLINAMEQKSISNKKIIGIYPVPNYDKLLLKIHSVLINNKELISKNLVLIPYKYDDELQNNPHFGLPLYYITKADSEYAKMKEIESKDTILFSETKTILLKKVDGESITDSYLKPFLSLFSGQNIKLKNELQKIMNIQKLYGYTGCETVLSYLKNNSYAIPQNKLGKGSPSYQFEDDGEFYSTYIEFTQNYMNTLKKLSELPQKTYDHAIENISSRKNFVFDFINPSNILVDYKTQEFNFIDFIFEEELIKNINIELQVQYFKKCLFGVNNKKLYQPHHLLLYKSDINNFINYEKLVTEKINNAVKTTLKRVRRTLDK